MPRLSWSGELEAARDAPEQLGFRARHDECDVAIQGQVERMVVGTLAEAIERMMAVGDCASRG